MTEERKQELGQLLEEAKKSLVVRYGYGGLVSLPVDIYQRYLEEHWACYGADVLSYAFSIRLTPSIVSETTQLKLLDFIREELDQYIKGDNILIAVCNIESDATDGSCLRYHGYPDLDLYFLIERLLEIASVRGIEEAVSVFDRCSCLEGTHDFFQDVALIDGIKIETPIQVFEGVRLVPLPSQETLDKVVWYLRGTSINTYSNQVRNYFGQTLLVIDRPGFSIFQDRTQSNSFLDGTRANDLPFPVEVHDVKFPNSTAVDSFKQLFCLALSLVCNTAVRPFHERWFFAENKSLNPHGGMNRVFRHRNPSARFTEVKEADIEKAKCLYERLVDLNSDDRSTMQIAIGRWIKSKTSCSDVDKIIDLGIAFEALYLSDIDEPTELSFRLRLHAGWHLGKDKKDRKRLMKEFREIYDWRSSVVHKGKLPNKKKKTPFAPEEVKQFIERAQDLCRQSIMKILDDGNFPDWNSLILGVETEGDVEGRTE